MAHSKPSLSALQTVLLLSHSGLIEQGHFTIRQAILKDCGKHPKQWPLKVSLTFFADHVTTRCSTGFSPFYFLHGTHLILPFDLTEATFIISSYRTGLSSLHQLDKRPADLKCTSKAIEKSKLASKGQFEKQFQHRLHTKSLGKGQLVLIRNSVCNTGLVNKYTPRYSGPYIIHRETKAGVYVLKELDGTFMWQAMASFRLLPYLPHVPGDL